MNNVLLPTLIHVTWLEWSCHLSNLNCNVPFICPLKTHANCRFRLANSSAQLNSRKESAMADLHIFFFPFMAHGHMIPMAAMARLFADRGVKVSIVTTPVNASFFQNTVDRATLSGHHLSLLLLPFPSTEAGLPPGCENLDRIASTEMLDRFRNALELLQTPLERLVRKHRPRCIVSDAFLSWTVDVAHQFNIPRLVFNGTCCFSHCTLRNVIRYKPYKSVVSDEEPFIVPGLPHTVKMTRSQLPDFVKFDGPPTEYFDRVMEAENRSDGFVMNTFYELEPDYVDCLKKEMGTKAWQVGPVSLFNRNSGDQAERGKKASINEQECLSWLDSRKPGSVVYICFGSVFRPNSQQLLEIASALEASDHPFIWVVKNYSETALNGFEQRMGGKGLVIRDWAPQILILNHPSVGAFVTHCGWNSLLEGVTAGVPMITWPATAEQFFNEKLITEVLRIAVGVGAEMWAPWDDEKRTLVKRERIEMAMRGVMDGGDEADGMRNRARQTGETAKKAVEAGGSSYDDLTRLIEELKTNRVSVDGH